MSAPTPEDVAARAEANANGAGAPEEDVTPLSALTWKLWTSDEIYAPLPAIEWLVEPIMPRGSVAMIAAFGSSLKSWAQLDLVDAIAMGRPWLGRFRVQRGRAVVIDFEAGSYELRRRLQRIALGREQDVRPAEDLAFVTMPGTSMSKPGFARNVRILARHFDLIVIDTLSAANAGENENDSRFAAPLYELKAIAEATGCTFLILHHTTKLGPQPTDRDLRETTRGTSAIFNALDVELKLVRSSVADTFVCHHTKTRGAKAIEPFTIGVFDVDSFATRVMSAKIDAHEAAPENSESKRIESLVTEIERALLDRTDAAHGERGLASILRSREVAFTNKDLGTAIRKLLDSGRLLNRGSDARPRYFLARDDPDHAGPSKETKSKETDSERKDRERREQVVRDADTLSSVPEPARATWADAEGWPASKLKRALAEIARRERNVDHANVPNVP